MKKWIKHMRNIEGLSFFGMGKKDSDPKFHQKKEEANQFEQYVFHNDERLVFNALSICVVSDRKDATRNKQIVMDTFRKHPRFFKVTDEKFANFLLMTGHLPMSLGGLDRIEPNNSIFNTFGFKVTVPREVALYSPLIADPKGHNKPKDRANMLLLGKGTHQIFNFSPFSSATNFNTCIIGTSGSGKSFFMQDLFATFYHGKSRVLF